ncbi:hypothetical protein PVAP13_2NG192000 [Panicum virgatum]|uniref:Uncharacterized protein n=1 Tax=Panicum virgatum TaxID=38727 RepID=A0A8T0VL18_PANVG|nr:hypothetical protein PVAP13_2NG192000 [Panicum virgatum]
MVRFLAHEGFVAVSAREKNCTRVSQTDPIPFFWQLRYRCFFSH